ncbi:hypothetical protein AgCh_028704 [Apium graveolens]
MRIGKKGKLSPRYIGPFEILRRIGKLAYELALPPNLQQVHNVFHVSMLRKYHRDARHIVEYEHVDMQPYLTHVEKPVKIMDKKGASASEQGSEILKKKVLTVLKAVEDKIYNEISVLDHLDLEDIKVLREWRLQQMKKMADKRRQGVALGYGEYLEIYVEKEFFSVVKASDRVVFQFYREKLAFQVYVIQVMKERAKNRVDDLQGMFCDLQSARKESRTNDVALLEEQVNQMLREWQSELNHPSPASSDTS